MLLIWQTCPPLRLHQYELAKPAKGEGHEKVTTRVGGWEKKFRACLRNVFVLLMKDRQERIGMVLFHVIALIGWFFLAVVHALNVVNDVL